MRILSDKLRASGISEEENGNICNQVVKLSKEIQKNDGVLAGDAMWMATKRVTGYDIQ